MKQIQLHVASLSGKEIKETVREVYIETEDGIVGVLQGHQPEFHSIVAGTMTYIKEDGSEVTAIVYDGFAQIEADYVRIGVKDILDVKDIDVEKLRSEIDSLKSSVEEVHEGEHEKLRKIEKEIEKRESLIKKADAS